MAKRGKRRAQFKSRFVGIEHLIIESPAFRVLSGLEVKLLVLVCARHNGENNGQIGFSVREAAALLGCTPNTAGKAFRGLCEKGFLAVTSQGAFSVKDRKATLWRITFYPSIGGRVATRDYARWQANGAEHKKQNTVSITDTDGITGEYRGPSERAEIAPTVSRGDTGKASQGRPTVSNGGTLIDSNHRVATSFAMEHYAIGAGRGERLMSASEAEPGMKLNVLRRASGDT